MALLLAALVVCVEVGTAFYEGAPARKKDLYDAVEAQVRSGELERDDAEDAREKIASRRGSSPPGLGIPHLALVDGLLMMAILFAALGVLVPERVQGRVQGIVTLVVSLLVLFGGIGAAFGAFGKLLLMLGLFLAAPFGTLAYIAKWGFFPRGEAAAILSLLMTMKILAVVCLVLAHQRFLQNKGLVLLILTSLLANVVVAFLHGLVPGVLVSVADVAATIVNAILGTLWGLFLLIGSLVSIVKLLRVDRSA